MKLLDNLQQCQTQQSQKHKVKIDIYPFVMKGNILCLIPGKGDFWIKFVVFLINVKAMSINAKP